MSLGTRKNTKDYPNHAFNLSRESDLNDKSIFLYDLHCLSEHSTCVSTLVHVHACFVQLLHKDEKRGTSLCYNV